MDPRSLIDMRHELLRELATLRREPLAFEIPSIIKLVLLEITRIIGPNEMRTDVDGLIMIERVVNEFGLTDVLSIEGCRINFLQELERLKHCHCIPRTVNLVQMVVHRLEQKISRDFVAANRYLASSTSNSQDPMLASVDVSHSQPQPGGSFCAEDRPTKRLRLDSSSVENSQVVGGVAYMTQTPGSGLPQPDGVSVFRNLEKCTDDAISIAMPMHGGNLNGLHDRVLQLLRENPTIGNYVDNEDVWEFVFKKCSEAIWKSAITDQGQGCSKQV